MKKSWNNSNETLNLMLQKLPFNRKLSKLNVFLMKDEEEVESSTKGQ